MRVAQNKFLNNQLVILKDSGWLRRQKHAGRCVANALKSCRSAVESKTPNLSLKDLENIALKQIEIMDCTATFHNFNGFPGHVCISVNNQLVHGIPSDYVLKDGDLVSVDLGATYEGAIADAARTWIYGEPKSKEHVRMLNTCWTSLLKAISAIEVGKHLGVIGYSIFQHVKNSGFGLVVDYGGHGINYNEAHAQPFVQNKSQPNEGVRIQNGLSIAIEPMLVMGEVKTKTLNDGWTVITPGMNCHFENSVTVFEDKVHIITEIPYEDY